MERTSKILRRSIHAFLQNYHCLTSVAAILAFPFAASLLLSQALVPPSSSPLLLLAIQHRIQTLFVAAGFPTSSDVFSILDLKISQTIFSFIFTLPFSLTFLILVKASIVETLREHPRRRPSPCLFSSLLQRYRPLLLTHLCNTFVILTANAAVFSLLFLAFTVVDILGLASSQTVILCLSAAAAIVYSIVLANTLVACNLAAILSVMENCSGYLPILKACLLIRGRAPTALLLALPTGLCMAAVEALFQYRVTIPYSVANRFSAPLMWEAFSITYIYSILVVLDIITSCMFYKSCILLEGRSDYPTELLVVEEEDDIFLSFKSKELPCTSPLGLHHCRLKDTQYILC